MFGSHLSIAGGLHLALLEAQRLKMDCVQIFTKNQRQWKTPALSKEQIAAWHDHVRSTGILSTVSHDSYLINLASPDRSVREKSIALFRQELRHCDDLDIPFLVAHPGSHMGAGEVVGLKRVIRALDRVHRDLSGCGVITCLEITAGQGTGLGYRFEHLRTVMDGVREPDRLAICFDTAHALAAGYDLTSAAGAKGVLQELNDVIGARHVRVLHVNDSRVPRGKRVDRHEHIGKGHVARAAFGVLLRHCAFTHVPKILETPKGEDDKGRNLDTLNLQRLRRLAATPPKTTKRKRSRE